MRAIIVDIDGTLADCRHRLHHVLPGGKRDWVAFFAAMANDTVITPIADLVAEAADGFKIVLCSGRPEDYRYVTECWLDDNCIVRDALYMRAAGDTRPDHIVKAQILRGIRDDGYDPFLVIDDRQSVVDMWREQGLICLQAAPPQLELPANAALTIMVGPSGAGKSKWLETNSHPSHVVSSDQIRGDICGDFQDQSRNVEVFAAVHALAATRLRHGLPTVIDATHIRRKDRMASAALAGDRPVTYVVINRPIADKRRTGGWRNYVQKKGGESFDLIGAHDATFQSNLKDILTGDGLPNVTVRDLRSYASGGVVREAA
jgi:predicted kinase